MNTHTPGPWVVVTELRNTDEIICDMMNSGYVAITQGQKLANWRNDAKLIAAAPDLLKALKACSEELRFMIDKHNVRNSDDGSFPYDHQTVAEAHAAIAKATQ